jgi:hypothetical protein
MRKRLLFRAALGIAAISPLLVIALVLLATVGPRFPSLPLGTIVITSAIVTIILHALCVGYFLYAVQNTESLDSASKTRWTYVLVLWFPFGAITYWYRYIWLEPSHIDG